MSAPTPRCLPPHSPGAAGETPAPGRAGQQRPLPGQSLPRQSLPRQHRTQRTRGANARARSPPPGRDSPAEQLCLLNSGLAPGQGSLALPAAAALGSHPSLFLGPHTGKQLILLKHPAQVVLKC